MLGLSTEVALVQQCVWLLFGKHCSPTGMQTPREFLRWHFSNGCQSRLCLQFIVFELQYSSAEAQPSLSVQSPTAPTVHSETLKASRAVQHLGHVVPNCVFGRAAAWGSKNSSVQAIRISRASQKEPFLASVNFARRQHVSTDRFFSTGAVRPISAEHRTEMVTPVQEETV